MLIITVPQIYTEWKVLGSSLVRGKNESGLLTRNK